MSTNGYLTDLTIYYDAIGPKNYAGFYLSASGWWSEVNPFETAEARHRFMVETGTTDDLTAAALLALATFHDAHEVQECAREALADWLDGKDCGPMHAAAQAFQP